MPNYQQGKIYTIRCRTDDTMIYVGSTTQLLCKRLYEHKSRCGFLKSLIYTTINGEWDNWYIELYELYPCNCKEELHKREGEIIRLIGTLNNNIANRTKEEWRKDNKDIIKEKNKKYCDENKNIKNEISKQHYEKNKDKLNEKITCECGCIINKRNIKIHKTTFNHINLINALYPSNNNID